MSRSDVEGAVRTAMEERSAVQRDLQQTLLSGLVLTLPLFITLLILGWILDMVSNALSPLVALLVEFGPTDGMATILVEGLAATLVFGVILAVGLAAQHGPNTHLGRRFDALMEDVPGVGSIYTSVERMSDVLVDGDTDSFREVKLVEFPRDDTFALAFLTATPAATIEDAVERDDLLTVFVPLAPNPVMGGHLLNVPQERVHDVDLSVEEGMEAIVTTGLTIDQASMDDAS